MHPRRVLYSADSGVQRCSPNIGQLTNIEPSPPLLPHRAGGPRRRRSSTPGCPTRRRSHPRPASVFLRAHYATQSLTRRAAAARWADSPERPPGRLGPPICSNQGSKRPWGWPYSGPRAAGIRGVNAGESQGPGRGPCRARQQVRGSVLLAPIPSTHAAADRGTISLEELARLDVIHGPRRAHARTYDAWTTAIQAAGPHFEFTDPPFHRSLPLTLAFAATANRPAAVLTGPATAASGRATPIRRPRPADTSGMVKVSLRHHPLTAPAALIWSSDLPRPLQQMLFQTADNLTTPPPPQPAELASPTAA